MLDQELDAMTFDERWERLPVKAPDPNAGGQEASGDSAHAFEKRKFVRLRCQGRAILDRQAERLAVYVVDLSRSGIGILSPVQLFPSELVQLTTPDRRLPLCVVRCVRLGPDCFHCGCRFQRQGERAMHSTQEAHGHP